MLGFQALGFPYIASPEFGGIEVDITESLTATDSFSLAGSIFHVDVSETQAATDTFIATLIAVGNISENITTEFAFDEGIIGSGAAQASGTSTVTSEAFSFLFKDKRQILKPPYLEDNPIWRDFITSLDRVFKKEVDDPTELIRKLRHLYLIPEQTEDNRISQRKLLSFSDFDQFEQEILIQQVNMLGFYLRDPSILTMDDYQRIFRGISSFWYEKGLGTFIDFVGFCVNAHLKMENLWTWNYKDFFLKADSKDVDLDLPGVNSFAFITHSSLQIPASNLKLLALVKLADYTNGGRQTLIAKWGKSIICV